MTLTRINNGQLSDANQVDQLIDLLTGIMNDQPVSLANALTTLKDRRISVQSPAFAASFTPDVTAGELIKIGALTANITVNNPSTPVSGQQLTLQFTQDATGGRTVTWGSALKTGWQPPPAPNAVDSVSFVYDGTNWQDLTAMAVDQLGNFNLFSVFNVKFYGAKGDGSTDDTQAIERAVLACYTAGGGIVWMPPTPNGYVLGRLLSDSYAQKGGGIRIRKNVSLLGNNTKLVLRGNAAFVTNRGPHNMAVVTPTITANILYGDVTITVDSSAGVVAGNDLFVASSQDRYDTTSLGTTFFAKALSVPDGTHITLDRPILFPMFITAPAAPTLVAAAGSTAYLAGTYTVGFTYVITAGTKTIESELSATNNVVLTAGQQINVSAITPLPTGVTAAKWYITVAPAGMTTGFVVQNNGSAVSLTAQGNGVAAPDKAVGMSTPAADRFLYLLDEVVENVFIRGFEMFNDIVNGGNAEFSVDLRFARNIEVEDINCTDPGAGFLAGWCDNITFRNFYVRQCLAQGGQQSKGRAGGTWGSNNILIENLTVEKFDGSCIFVEEYSRRVVVRNIRITNNSTTKLVGPALFQIGEESQVHLENIYVDGKGNSTTPFNFDDSGGTMNFLTMFNITINVDAEIRSLHLAGFNGWLILGPSSAVAGKYIETKRFSKIFRLTPNMSNVDIGLPAGLMKRFRIWVSTVTGITAFYVGNTSTLGSSLLLGIDGPTLIAQTTLEYLNYGTVGDFFPVNTNALQKRTAIYTGGDVPGGAYGAIEIEYLTKIADFPANTSGRSTVSDNTEQLLEDTTDYIISNQFNGPLDVWTAGVRKAFIDTSGNAAIAGNLYSNLVALSVSVPSAPTFVVTGSGSTAYAYKTVAISAAGDGVPSTASASQNNAASLDAITNFNTVTVSQATGATGYKLLRSVAAGAYQLLVVLPPNVTSFKDSGQYTATTYTVATKNPGGMLSYTADRRVSVQAPAFAASFTPDPTLGEVISVGILTANITINNVTSPVVGQAITLVFTQDATGGRTVTWGSTYKVNWVPSTAPSAKNTITFIYDGTNWIQTSVATSL